MKFQQLVVLLPCHSLEDFPVHHEGHLADGLLSAWSALWHPALVASAEAMPTWRRAEEPPENPENCLIVVPEASRDWTPCGWSDDAQQRGAIVLEDLARRDEILAAALGRLDPLRAALDPELAADFLALGFAYLQVELLTRQMRYSSYIDETFLGERVVSAAKAAVAGNSAAARSDLATCFDTLGQARDHFYPVDSYLVDLMLLAPTTLGAPLRADLQGEIAANVLLSGALLDEVAAREPETLTALRARLERGTLSFVGGEQNELEATLLPREVILNDLLEGRRTYVKHLGREPKIFGRRRGGLSSIYPQLLHKLAFQGAVHATFDGGRQPEAAQTKARWEGDDGSAIDCVARMPLDASRPETFLSLSHRLGETMDSDHVATLLFARWPGAASPWYYDLRRVAKYGPLLGRFVTLEDYFTNTFTVDSTARFLPDEYRSGYLSRAVETQQANPLSSLRDRHCEQARRAAAKTVETLATLVRDRAEGVKENRTTHDAVDDFAQGLGAAAKGEGGYLLVNPSASARRFCVTLPELAQAPALGDPVRATALCDGAVQAVVDVPGAGFAWVGAGEREKVTPPAKLPLAEQYTLRNEYFEVAIQPTTGAMQSLRSYERRGNLLAQQLAYRAPKSHGWRPEPAALEPDSVMACDAVEVVASTPVMGELVSRGRLLNLDGELLAHFEQRMQLWRGSRILLLDVKLEPVVEPGPHPWTSYYGCRFAWSDSTAELWRSVGEGAFETKERRIESPLFLEIREGERRLTLFTAGMTFHKRTSERVVETLLRVPGETATRFRFGIGVDVAHPLPAALDLLLPEEELLARTAPPAGGSHGWLFHVNAPNVVATDWSPLVEEGRVAGFRVRLLETEGRAGRFTLSVFREIAVAMQTDYQGEPHLELPLEQGRIMIDIARYEWVQVEARWKR